MRTPERKLIDYKTSMLEQGSRKAARGQERGALPDVCFMMDNGSSLPSSTLALRALPAGKQMWFPREWRPFTAVAPLRMVQRERREDQDALGRRLDDLVTDASDPPSAPSPGEPCALSCVRETEILVEQQPPQGVLVCDHAGPVINKFSQPSRPQPPVPAPAADTAR